MSARASRPLVVMAGLIVLATTLAACGDAPIKPEPTPVTGGGDIVIDDRTAGPIERISIGAAVTVVMKLGSEPSVTIEGQANVIPLVITETRDGQLIVHVPAPGYITQESVTITVVAPMITSVAMSAGSTGSLELTGDALNVDLSGKASLAGVGRVERLTLVASSDGRIDFTSLTAGTATVRMSGGAAATLAVEGLLAGTAEGGATITLTRQPGTVNVETSSGGSVQSPG